LLKSLGSPAEVFSALFIISFYQLLSVFIGG